MTRKSAQSNSNSLRTFFAYGGIVLFFVLISLLIKAAFIIQASKFDGKHQFILSIYQNNKIKEIIKFNSRENKIYVAQIKEGDDVEIIPDAKVNSNFNLPLGTNTLQTISTVGLKYNSLNTDLTFFDIVRLYIFSYKSAAEPIDINTTKNFFFDESISSENIAIEVVNASGISGEGKRLENALNNLGFNIISVTTAREEEELSRIQYIGEETYTLKKLKRILGFSVKKVDKRGVADIVIIIGKNNKQ